MAQAKSKMTPLARWEWLVGLSPVAATILAYLALTNLSLEAPAVGFTAVTALTAVHRATPLK